MNSVLTALINGAIAGAGLTAVVWMGLALAPRRGLNAATRYFVWWAALTVVVALPFAYLPAGARANVLPEKPAATEQAVVAERGPIFPVASVPPARSWSDSDSGLVVPRFPVTVRAGWWVSPTCGAGLLLVAWMLVRLLAVSVALRGVRMHATPAPMADRLPAWLERSGCGNRAVHLGVSAEIAVPMVVGVLRPAILIPAAVLEQLSPVEVDQVGLHEAAHVARGDHRWLWLERAIEALFAWHPAVWWIARQIDFEREVACDDMVLRDAAGPAYALCLTRVLELAGSVRGSRMAVATVEGGSRLGRRVDLLLDGTRHKGTTLLKGRAVCALAMLGLLALPGFRTPRLLAFTTPSSVAPAQPVAPQSLPERAPAGSIAREASAPETFAQQAPASPPVQLSISVNVVELAVNVTDANGRPVPGLDKSAFRVLDDDVEQVLSDVEFTREPTSLAIVVDASGSMRERIDTARRAIARIGDALGSLGEFCLIVVHEQAELASPWTADWRRVEAALAAVETRGGTSLREGLVLAAQQLRGARRTTKALLVVSDGNDNSSSITEDTARVAVKDANAQVHALSVVVPPAAVDERGFSFLRLLALETGGSLTALSNGAELPAEAAALAPMRYRVRYHPSNIARDGRFHRVRVEVRTPPGAAPYTVQTREGYYAPPDR